MRCLSPRGCRLYTTTALHARPSQLVQLLSGISIYIRRSGYLPTLSFTLHSLGASCLYHVCYCNLYLDSELNGQLQFIE